MIYVDMKMIETAFTFCIEMSYYLQSVFKLLSEATGLSYATTFTRSVEFRGTLCANVN